ncbi:aspartate ammonia-lyase [Amorphus suaedae]
MEDRVRRMKRIQTVQEQMHRLAEQRLSGLVSAEKELRRHEEQLVTSLDEATLLHGLFVEQMARRVRTVAVEAAATAAQAVVQREKLLEEKLKLKRVEDATRRIEREYQRILERKRLEEVVRPVSRVGDASLP